METLPSKDAGMPPQLRKLPDLRPGLGNPQVAAFPTLHAVEVSQLKNATAQGSLTRQPSEGRPWAMQSWPSAPSALGEGFGLAEGLPPLPKDKDLGTMIDSLGSLHELGGPSALPRTPPAPLRLRFRGFGALLPLLLLVLSVIFAIVFVPVPCLRRERGPILVSTQS